MMGRGNEIFYLNFQYFYRYVSSIGSATIVFCESDFSSICLYKIIFNALHH